MAHHVHLSREELLALEPRWPDRASSWIWRHACLVETRAVCLHCGYQTEYINATNMESHLKNSHKLVDIDPILKKRARPASDQPLIGQAFYSLSPARKESINKALIMFIATGSR